MNALKNVAWLAAIALGLLTFAPAAEAQFKAPKISLPKPPKPPKIPTPKVPTPKVGGTAGKTGKQVSDGAKKAIKQGQKQLGDLLGGKKKPF